MEERVLITGAACRIGRAIALALASRGAKVIVHYNHSRDEAFSLLNMLEGEGHSAIQCDFSDMAQVSDLIPELCRRGTAPTALVNNASVYTRVPLAESEPEATEQCMRVNFHAPFELMRQFRKCVGKGAVVNLTDQRNAYPDPPSGVYGIAKKALQHVSEAAALEWAPQIRVNCIAPGIVLPPPGKSWEKMQPLLEKIPLCQRTAEEEIAQAVILCLESPFLTGQTLFADGGLHLLGHSVETRP